MTEFPGSDRPPPPGEEAAPGRDREPSWLRRAAKPVLIGLVGLGISIAFPILLVIILAFVAQLIISH